MHVLVTGAAGFVGSHLCERLLALGDTVTGIDNFDPFYDPAIKRANLSAIAEHPKFTLIEGDIREYESLASALGAAGIQETDVIVHLAARPGVRPSIEQPIEYSRTNLDGTVVMLQIARRLGAGRFVFGSSSSVYGNNERVPFSETDPVERPISPYAATKRGAELLCHTFHHLYGLSVVCLRFFTVYGPRQRPDLAIHKFTRLMAAGDPIPLFGDGSMSRDYTYVDDILQGVDGAIELTAGKSPIFEIINLGESRTTTTMRLIELIAAELGVTPNINWLPVQPGDVERTFADVSKARRLFGYDPTTPVEVGIPLFVNWYRQANGGRLGTRSG